ncbi:MAG: hypothetical protein ACLR0N_12765 [Bilophila wadsworthia]
MNKPLVRVSWALALRKAVMVGVVDWNSLDPTWQDRLSQLKPEMSPDCLK